MLEFPGGRGNGGIRCLGKYVGNKGGWKEVGINSVFYNGYIYNSNYNNIEKSNYLCYIV